MQQNLLVVDLGAVVFLASPAHITTTQQYVNELRRICPRDEGMCCIVCIV